MFLITEFQLIDSKENKQNLEIIQRKMALSSK